MFEEIINGFNWLFTPLFNSNFVNCFGDLPCYKEPFGLLPMPISIIAGIILLIGWKKGWFKGTTIQTSGDVKS